VSKVYARTRATGEEQRSLALREVVLWREQVEPALQHCGARARRHDEVVEHSSALEAEAANEVAASVRASSDELARKILLEAARIDRAG